MAKAKEKNSQSPKTGVVDSKKEKSYLVKNTFSMTGVNGICYKAGDKVEAKHLLNIEDHIKGGFLEEIK